MEAVIRRAEEVERGDQRLPAYVLRGGAGVGQGGGARLRRGRPSAAPARGHPRRRQGRDPDPGQPLTQASLIHRDDVADHTAVVPDRVIRAGGIVHARGATPEFSSAAFTHSRLYGITRNPWNTDYSPGGSTGGGAAALAAGSAMLGDRLGHRRLHPNPRHVQRRRRIQASLWARAGPARRTTSTTSATTARWRGRWRTARFSRTSSPARILPTPSHCGRSSAFGGAGRDRRLADRLLARPRLPGRPGGARGGLGGRRGTPRSGCDRRGGGSRLDA